MASDSVERSLRQRLPDGKERRRRLGLRAWTHVRASSRRAGRCSPFGHRRWRRSILADWPSRRQRAARAPRRVAELVVPCARPGDAAGAGRGAARRVATVCGSLADATRRRIETVPRTASGQSSPGLVLDQGTFSWAEPTAWALFALKKCLARGMVISGADARIRDGEAVLRDRVCATGGWNYGNSNVFGKNLPAVCSDDGDCAAGAAGSRRRGLRATEPRLPRRESRRAIAPLERSR